VIYPQTLGVAYDVIGGVLHDATPRAVGCP